MKTLHKQEVLLSLTVLVVYLFCFLFRDYIFISASTYFGENFIGIIDKYKTDFFIFVVPFLLFFSLRLHNQYKAKVLNLQQQYYNLFDGNPMPLVIIDPATKKIIAANKASTKTYGYSLQEFLNLTISDISADGEKSFTYQDLNTINYGLKKESIIRHKKKNGEVFLVEVSFGDISFNDKNCKLLLAHDITEIVQAKEEKRIAEEEKAKQHNFTSYVIDNFPVDVAVFDKNHKYILLNKTAVKDDVTRKWMIGKDDFDYFRRKGADLSSAQKRRERFLKAIEGESKEWIDEHVVNGKVKHVLRKFYPYYENGELKYVYGYGMDVTDLKKAQSQRNVYIEQLEKIAFATSHKIRQPICNLQGLISLFEMEKIESQQVENIFTCMKNSISALDEFTRDLGIKLQEYKQNLSKQDSDYN